MTTGLELLASFGGIMLFEARCLAETFSLMDCNSDATLGGSGMVAGLKGWTTSTKESFLICNISLGMGSVGNVTADNGVAVGGDAVVVDVNCSGLLDVAGASTAVKWLCDF